MAGWLYLCGSSRYCKYMNELSSVAPSYTIQCVARVHCRLLMMDYKAKLNLHADDTSITTAVQNPPRLKTQLKNSFHVRLVIGMKGINWHQTFLKRIT